MKTLGVLLFVIGVLLALFSNGADIIWFLASPGANPELRAAAGLVVIGLVCLGVAAIKEGWIQLGLDDPLHQDEEEPKDLNRRRSGR